MGQLQHELDMTIELLREAPRNNPLQLEHDCSAAGDLAGGLWDVDEYHHPVYIEAKKFRSFTINELGDSVASDPLCAEEPGNFTGFFRGFTAESSLVNDIKVEDDRPGLVTESLTHAGNYAFFPLDGVVVVHHVTDYLEDRNLLQPVTSCLLGSQHARIEELAELVHRTNILEDSTTARILELYMNQLCEPNEVMASVVGDLEFLNPQIMTDEETGEILILGMIYAFGVESPVTEDYVFTIATHPVTHNTCLALGRVVNGVGEATFRTIYIPHRESHLGLGGFEGFTLPDLPQCEAD